MATKLTVGTTNVNCGVNIANFTLTAASDSTTATTVGLSGDTGADAQLPATWVGGAGDGAGVPSGTQLSQRVMVTLEQTSSQTTELAITKGGTPWRITFTPTSGAVGSWNAWVDYKHSVGAGR